MFAERTLSLAVLLTSEMQSCLTVILEIAYWTKRKIENEIKSMNELCFTSGNGYSGSLITSSPRPCGNTTKVTGKSTLY